MSRLKPFLSSVERSLKSIWLRATELPWQEIGERDRLETRDQAIPTVVYQTWEDKRFGKTHAEQLRRFRALNPELDFKLFDRAERDGYMRASWGEHPIYEVYTAARFGAMLADIFRYCIIHERGGYYMDINKGCTVPLTSLHPPEAKALIAFERNACPFEPEAGIRPLLQHPDKLVLQWGFGFAAGHPIPAHAIEGICADYAAYRKKRFAAPKPAIVAFTGPERFTHAVRKHFALEGADGVTQAGIDFNETGIFGMPGSKVRYLTASPYWIERDAVIVE